MTPDNETFANPPAAGNFVRPTLLANVDHGMAVMRDETFGPVLPVMKVGSDDEAVRLMNDSQFGLTASIWTRDTDKAYSLADEIEAGTVFVNRCDYPSPVRMCPHMCSELTQSTSLPAHVPCPVSRPRSPLSRRLPSHRLPPSPVVSRLAALTANLPYVFLHSSRPAGSCVDGLEELGQGCDAEPVRL